MRDLHFSAKPASIPLIAERKKMDLQEARRRSSTVKFGQSPSQDNPGGVEYDLTSRSLSHLEFSSSLLNVLCIILLYYC